MYDGINNFTLPEWIENDISPVGGLDLLGLRNVAQTISNHCLNGITTISPQIRYLCLRSWFIQMYEKCNLPDIHRSESTPSIQNCPRETQRNRQISESTYIYFLKKQKSVRQSSRTSLAKLEGNGKFLKNRRFSAPKFSKFSKWCPKFFEK